MSHHPSPTSARIRVVVADDSRFMRRMLSDALTAGGFEVVGTAANGDEALGVCTRLRPDVLTLDLAMPGLDGIGVLRALRDASSPIPVVVVSAFSPAHGARAVDALAEGAVDLVVKPAATDPPGRFAAELSAKVLAAAAAPPRSKAAHVVAPAPPAPPVVAAPRPAGATPRPRPPPPAAPWSSRARPAALEPSPSCCRCCPPASATAS